MQQLIANGEVSNDGVVDAFTAALTASPKTGAPRTHPEDPPTEDTGNLSMEMVYTDPEHES